MAATLKICFIIHVEDSSLWSNTPPTPDTSLGSLALEISKNGRGGKLSVQFGRNFLDSDGAAPHYPLGAETNLRTVLHCGGNFWVHSHDGAYNSVLSNYSCVQSAFYNEGGPVNYPAGGPGGRSGGWEFSGIDWVTITLGLGMRLMNSAVMGTHARVPITMRPYGASDEEIQKLYPKGQAPGPLHSDVMTMRQRPFWMDTSSLWHLRPTTVTYATTTNVGSVMMIPAPGKLDLPGLAEGRTAYDSLPLTDDDFKYALTQAWATHDNMATYPNTSTNAWYTHLPLRNINNATIETMGWFVESLNAIFDMSGTPKAAWKNMNEIGSLFADPMYFRD